MIAPSYTKKVTDFSELFVGPGYLLKTLILYDRKDEMYQ